VVCGAVFAVASGVAMSLGPVLPAVAADYDRDTGLATFDETWRIVQETYYDTTFGGLDWTAMRDRYRPRAEAAGDNGSLRGVVREMLARLGDSHFALIEGSAADARDRAARRDRSGDAGLEVRLVNGEPMVTRVEPDRGAAKAGVRAGWTVRAIDGVPVEEILGRVPTGLSSSNTELEELLELWRALLGAPGSEAMLLLRDETGEETLYKAARTPSPGELFRLGALPAFRSHLQVSVAPTPAGHRAAVFRYNVWTLPIIRGLDQAVDTLRTVDGWVFDLRGNLGGIAQMVMGISGHILDEPLSLGSIVSRKNKLELRANPRRVSAGGERVTPFAGPVAILVDQLTYSASELFAAGLQDLGRARVFGVTTLGGVLAASFTRLPNGDLLEHPVADYLTPSGIRVEGRGVIPDAIVPPDRARLLEGRDPVLEEALHWIEEESTP